MTEDLRLKLADELLRHASWSDVQPHVLRDVVFVVRRTPLLDAALVLALDDAPTLKSWLADGTLARPTPDESLRWSADATRFATLIVAPFVLIQEETTPPPELPRD